MKINSKGYRFCVLCIFLLTGCYLLYIFKPTFRTKWLVDIPVKIQKFKPEPPHTYFNNSFYAEPYDNKSTSGFLPYTGEGVVSFRDLCIEEDIFAIPVEVEPGYRVTAKKLVIYNSYNDEPLRFTISATSNRPDHFYWVNQNSSSIPINHTYISESPAYFAMPSCTGNIFHFWNDFYIGIFGVLKATHRLSSVTSNQLYYRDPLVEQQYDDCNAFKRYQDLLFILPIKQHHSSYHDEMPNTCYKNAVFGWKPTRTEEVTEFLADRLGINNNTCKNGTVTLVQRRYRRILNLEELKEAAHSVGFKHVNIVMFEDMSIKHQLITAYCTDIMVGVHGAGLQWASFMRPHSGLIELGWHFWDPGWYANYFGQYQGFVATTLQAEKIKLNWESYSRQVRRGVPVSEEEMYSLSRKGPVNAVDNHWKWADGIFNNVTFSDRLLFVASRIFNGV